MFVDTEGEKFGSDVSGEFEVLGFDLLSVVKRNDIEEEIPSEVFDFLEVIVKSILSVVCLVVGSIVGVGISIEERFFPNVVSFSGKFSFKFCLLCVELPKMTAPATAKVIKQLMKSTVRTIFLYLVCFLYLDDMLYSEDM